MAGYKFAGKWIEIGDDYVARLFSEQGGELLKVGFLSEVKGPARAALNSWERAAWEFGKEAQANGRRNMVGDDRSDIAHYAGVEKWTDMPDADRQRATELFYDGMAVEKRSASELGLL